MPDAQASMSRRPTRVERSSQTRALLAAGAATADPASRRAILSEVAELNISVVSAVVASVDRRYRYTQVDMSAVAECARRAYTRAVLGLDPAPDLDLLPRVVPEVRDAVQRCVRRQLAEVGPSGPR